MFHDNQVHIDPMVLMKSPFLIAITATAAGLLIAFVLVFWKMVGKHEAALGAGQASGAPWSVRLPAPGRAEVLGLRLPGTTLAEVRQRWMADVKLALITSSDGNLALEGYVETFEAGGVTGRLMLVFDAQTQAEVMRHWRDTLPALPMASGGRQYALSESAATDLAKTALIGLSFIPLAQLDAEVLTARFGQPAERIAPGGRLEHWLYPALGLAVVLDAEGRDVLQYVAPGDFEHRLAAPLRTTAAKR